MSTSPYLRLLCAAFAAMAISPALHAAPAQTRIAPSAIATATALRDRATSDTTAWQVAESLTTQVGPRMAGSPGDARAVEWAKARFKALGYDKVWTQPVTFPKWERRSEHAAVLGAHAQPLAVTALGGSPAGKVTGEVVRFETLDALTAVAPGSLAGKVVFVDHAMQAARDGSGYGPASRIRSRGPSAAIRAGAVGYLMRSAGTGDARFPHTGITRFEEGLTPIPSAALALPDADQLARLVALGNTRVELAIDAGWSGQATSYNVIGEITGRGRLAKEMVVIGGHLDSWDLGTGAIDDASGIAITMAAGHLIGQLPQRPARSIRVIAYANEEQGLFGADVYAKSQAGKERATQVIAESDFGAGRIYAFNTSAPEHAKAATQQIADVLAPLGIAYTPGEGGPGSDAAPSAARGVAWAALSQDGTRYFDLHHTADDTLDKIVPAELAQNVAAYAAFAYLAAQADGDFGSVSKEPAAQD